MLCLLFLRHRSAFMPAIPRGVQALEQPGGALIRHAQGRHLIFWCSRRLVLMSLPCQGGCMRMDALYLDFLKLHAASISSSASGIAEFLDMSRPAAFASRLRRLQSVR